MVKLDGTENTEVTVDSIEENLNGHIEAVIVFPNTATYRTYVESDHVVEIFYNTSSEFKGVMKAPEFQRDKILCKCYQTAEEIGQRKEYSGLHQDPPVAPNTVFAAICTAAGIIAGVCPTTPNISVRFKRAYCYDSARYVAWVLGKDLYSDFDGSGNPRYNIGTAGTGGPSGRGYLHISVAPKRGKDRGKKRDKVYLRGLDVSGNEIEGSAGTGADVWTGTDRTTSDITTLNALAAKKLAELNTDSSGCAITCPLESPTDATPAYVQAFDLHAGDYVIVNSEELSYTASVVRVAKVTKTSVEVIVEVEKAEKLIDDYLEENAAWESLGIFPPSTEVEPDIDPVVPTGFGTDDVSVVPIVDADNKTQLYFRVRIHQISGMAGYIVRYKVSTDTYYLDAGTPDLGGADTYINIGPVISGKDYNIGVCSFNHDERYSAFCADVTKTATKDTSIPATPTGLTATSLVHAVYLAWNPNTETDLWRYRIYRNTTTTWPDEAGLIGYAITNNARIESDDVTEYYYWVTAEDFSANKSGHQVTPAGPIHGTPEDIGGIIDVVPNAPATVTTSTGLNTDAEGYTRAYLTVQVSRVTVPTGACAYYIVAYKQSAASNWEEVTIGQPASGDAYVTVSDMPLNTTFNFRACAVSKMGARSAYTSGTDRTTGTDTSAPPVPSSIVATAYQGGVLIEVGANMAGDFAYFELYKYPTNTPGSAVKFATTGSTFYFWKAPTAELNTTWYFWAKQVDLYGNASALSTAVDSARPVLVSTEDIGPSEITSELIMDYEIGETKLAADAIQFTSSRQGLQLAMNFDKKDGNTVYDYSGNENLGACTGCTLAEGKFGQALSFNGTTDFCAIADIAGLNILNPPMSVFAWVYPNADHTGYILARNLSASTDMQYALYFNNAATQIQAYLEGAVRTSSLSGSVPLNTWSFVGFTWAADGTVQCYVNGVASGSSVVFAGPLTTRPYVRVGARYNGVFFGGLIDELRLYNRALSLLEVRSIYRLGPVTDPASTITTSFLGNESVTQFKLAANAVTSAKVDSAYKIIEILSALPAAGTAGRTVYLTTDGHVYRDNGSSWKKLILPADIMQHLGGEGNPNISGAIILDDTLASAALKAGIQPYTSDIVLSASGSHDAVSYTYGTIRFADGGTQTINTGSPLSLASATGWWFIYFQIGNGALLATQTYSSAVGDDRGLIGLAYHSSLSEQQVAVQAFAAKGMNLNADMLGANCVTAGKILAGSVDTTKLNVQSHFIEDLVWTSNTPSAGYVTWTAGTIRYETTTGNISAGNTNYKYIYWLQASPDVLQFSNSKPTLTISGCLVCINDGGTARPQFTRTMISGSNIETQTVTALEIAAHTITANEIYSHTIDTDCLAVDAVMFGTNRLNMVLHMPLDRLVGSVVDDFSGEDNHGTNSGADLEAGSFGNALHFLTANSDKVIIPNSTSLDGITGAVTIEAWLNPDTDGTGSLWVICKNEAGTADTQYGFYFDYANDRIIAYLGGTAVGGSTTGYVDKGVWTHVAVTWNDTDDVVTYYVNGVPRGTSSKVGPLTSNGKSLKLGCRGNGVGLYSNYYKGLLDEIRIYNRRLTEAEIVSNYRLGALTTNPTVITENMLKTGCVTADKIAVGALEAEKIKAVQVYLGDDIVFADGNPITWTAGHLYYDGTEYSILAGSTTTAAKYVYWSVGDTAMAFRTSGTKPSYYRTGTIRNYIIAIDVSDVARVMWNATLIDGGTLLADSITANELAANSVDTAAISVGCILPAHVNFGDPVLMNGGFEADENADNEPDCWTCGGSHVRSSTIKHSGTYALYIPTNASEFNSYSDKIYVGAGNKVGLWFWYYSDVINGTLTAQIRAYDAAGTLLGNTAVSCSATAAATWYLEESAEYTLPTNTNYIRVMFIKAAGSVGNIYVDDAVCKRSADIIEINAAKVLINGTTYLSNWSKSGDLTKIDGGRISTKTIVVGGLADAVTALMFGTAAEKTDVLGWGWPSDLTYIDGGNIYTGSILAASIGAGQITTSKLDVRAITPEKFALATLTDNLIKNGNMEDPNFVSNDEGWQTIGSGGTFSFSTAYAKSGIYSLRFAPTSVGGTMGVYSNMFPVDPDSAYGAEGQYKVEMWVKGSGTDTISVTVYYFDAGKVAIGSNALTPISGFSTASWRKYVTYFKPDGKQSGNYAAKYALIYVYIGTIVAAGVYYYFDDVCVHRAPYTWEAELLPMDAGGYTEKYADSTALNGYCRRALTGNTAGNMTSGPFASLPAGKYRAHWSIRLASATSTGKVLDLLVYTTTAIANRAIYPGEFLGDYTTYRVFTLPFRLSSSTVELQFLTSYSAGTWDVRVDRCWIEAVGEGLGEITTDVLTINGMTTDPSYSKGKMWYRDDLDQIRFSAGTTITDVYIIPKYPLSELQAAGENMVWNPGFEFDRDFDLIPDNWYPFNNGTGTPVWQTVEDTSYKGAKCLDIYCSVAGNDGCMLSEYMPVIPGGKYWISAMVKSSLAGTLTYSPVMFQECDRDKAGILYTSVGSGVLTTSWVRKGGVFTMGSTTYWIRMNLKHYFTTSARHVYFDNVIVSQGRAAVQSGASVSGPAQTSMFSMAATGGVWNTTSYWDFNAPSINMDFLVLNVVLSPDVYSTYCYVKATIDSTDYPGADGIYSFMDVNEDHLACVIIIPGNMNGKTVHMYIKPAITDTVGVTVHYYAIASHYHV